jgi:hypothetical protein
MAKSRWDEIKEKLPLVEGWARNGLTDEQIAHNLGIGKDTFYRYKREHSDFEESLKRNKEVADLEVEGCLFKRATGYTYEEVTSEVRVIDGEPVMMETKRVTKEVAPDVTAQIFWLKNRKPNEWRDKKDVEMSGKVVMFEGVDVYE